MTVEIGLRFFLLICSRVLSYGGMATVLDIVKQPIQKLEKRQKKFKKVWVLFFIKSVTLMVSFYFIWIVFRVKLDSIMTYLEPLGWFAVSFIANIIFYRIQISKNNRDVFCKTVVAESLLDVGTFVLSWMLMFLLKDELSVFGL